MRQKAGRFPHEFACWAVQTVLPLSLLRHSRAERREQDYPDADRKKGALQSARSRLLHPVSQPFSLLFDITKLFIFGLFSSSLS